MSRRNKVNPDHYTMAGRLSADDLARERMRQAGPQSEGGRARNKAVPPWMAKEAASDRDATNDRDANDDRDATDDRGASDDRGAAEDTGSDRGEVTAPKRARPAPRRKVTGQAPATARRKTTKASGAKGTPKTRKAPTARGSAARGASKQRAGAPRMRKGRTTGAGVTRKKQKKKRS